MPQAANLDPGADRQQPHRQSALTQPVQRRQNLFGQGDPAEIRTSPAAQPRTMGLRATSRRMRHMVCARRGRGRALPSSGGNIVSATMARMLKLGIRNAIATARSLRARGPRACAASASTSNELKRIAPWNIEVRRGFVSRSGRRVSAAVSPTVPKARDSAPT